MSFDGSGNYSPPAAPTFPAIAGNTILASYFNATINDIAAALSICITRDGQGKPSANIDWNGKNLSGVGVLTASSLILTGGAMGVAAGGTGITTVPANGQLLIGNGTNYVAAFPTGGGGITVTAGAGTLAFANSGLLTASGFTANTGILLGRTTAAVGAVEEITIGAGLSLAAGVLAATGSGSVSLAALTINNSGSGAASGSTYDGSIAKTISYNSIGAQPSTPVVQTVASSASVTPVGTGDMTVITAQAANLTLANPSGSPVQGFGHVIRIKDNGTARTISYGTEYRALGITLPTTTVSNKTLYLGMIYNSTDTKWDVVSAAQEA